MSVTPRGMSVQEAYRLYRDQKLQVNRRYQRKLVWTVDEKARLIDSILRDYPIPLILFAEKNPSYYEIIDGMQRLNAVFSFIENAFSINQGYFDIREFARAKQAADAELFQTDPEVSALLSPEQCANFLDYQLAVTIFPTSQEDDITAIFNRINSGGKQLSFQERRQAGVVTPFARLVREIATELRGDVSEDTLLLINMPEISIESRKSKQGYKVQAEDTLWCRQGILRVSNLRDSEDEQMIADIAASVLLGEPLASSRELLDDIYTASTSAFDRIETALAAYSAKRLSYEIISTFSVLKETIESYNNDVNCLRNTVNPHSSGNPIKTLFYAIFMAFFEFVVDQKRSPDDPNGIMHALNKLSERIRSTKKATTAERIKNIDITKGLIDRYFVKVDPPVLGHGPGLAFDFENSLRRSLTETPHYELKQGMLQLHTKREVNEGFVQSLIETICGIANATPHGTGYLFIGVADNEKDALRIQELDDIVPITVGSRFVVGIDREAKILNISIEQYFRNIVEKTKRSALSEHLKTTLLSHCDIIEYKKLSVIRFAIPRQSQISFVGNEAFIREGSSTVKVTGPSLISVSEQFSHK